MQIPPFQWSAAVKGSRNSSNDDLSQRVAETASENDALVQRDLGHVTVHFAVLANQGRRSYRTVTWDEGRGMKL